MIKSHRKKLLPPEELNIVSLMDILTTMLFFLILFASFSNFAVLKGSSLVSSSAPSSDPKPVFTLKVHMKSEKSYEVWLGPTTGVKTLVDEGKLNRAFAGNGSSGRGYTKNLSSSDPKNALKQLRNTLAFVKMAFPHDTKVVLAVNDSVSYQAVINTMSSLRTMEDAEEAFTVKTLIGHPEKTKVLFPEVILSEAKL
jgi:biopolymer transport protein ExbD